MHYQQHFEIEIQFTTTSKKRIINAICLYDKMIERMQAEILKFENF